MSARFLIGLALIAAASSSPVAAQRPPLVSVQGVAFDSLRGIPLSNAFVILQERSKSTVSDIRGRFRFDSVPPGTYTFSMQHAVFDSLGLSGATVRATVTDGKAPVTLAVPSFAALWTSACGGVPVPGRDTGFVYGTVKDAKTKQPVGQAWVEISWYDVVKLDPAKKSLNITQRKWKSEIQSDAQGGYAVCNTPIGLGLTVRAFYGTSTTPSITLSPVIDKVRRMDVVLSRAADAVALRGTVRGSVVDTVGRPIRDFRVAVGPIETRSDAEGRFVLRGLPAGTQQIDASSVGFNPVSAAVDIFADDTAQIVLASYRINALDTLKVRALSVQGRTRLLEFEGRRKQGYGTYLDSNLVKQRATLSAAFQAAPGVTVESMSSNGRRFNLWLYGTGTNSKCLANLMLDGVQQTDTEILNTMVPSEIAAIEVYQQKTTVPTELMRSQQSCGLIAVWTKRAFK